MNKLIQLRRRKVSTNSALLMNLHPLLRRIYSQRGITDERELKRSVKFLHSWHGLNNIELAVEFLYQALRKQKQIMIVGDFDADGATSVALTMLALRSMGYQHIQYLVPNRLYDGYGLSTRVVEQALIRGAGLILTVDNGISSHDGIMYAHQKGIPVLVTDHHLPGETLPIAAAIVNPNLDGNTFPSRALAGVGVAFYLMLALRAYLRERGWFSNGLVVPNLSELLDLVALGTVADVVPLDANNRILVWQGIIRIRARKCRPGIIALLETANCNTRYLAASDLGFVLGPRLNAAGRLNDMSIGVALLLTEDSLQARMLANKLDVLNKIRKNIEQEMQVNALTLCNQLESSGTNLPCGLAFYHPAWHHGVIGILASRLKQRFNRPVIVFAPTGDGILKGSGRSVFGLHLRDILERMNTINPELILKFGGHSMAVGLSIKENKFQQFNSLFNVLVEEWLDKESLLHDVIWSDGALTATDLTLSVAEMLRDAGPWGQEFPDPIFDGRFKLLKQRLIGKCHLKVTLEPVEGGGPLLDGIAFNIDTCFWPNTKVHQAELAYKLDVNDFRGKRSIQLLIEHIWPL